MMNGNRPGMPLPARTKRTSSSVLERGCLARGETMNDVIRVIETETPGVVEVRLNRPDKHNALNSELFAALAEMAERLSAWQGLRAVVLSGEGKSFCAGLDMENFSRMAQGSGAG